VQFFGGRTRMPAGPALLALKTGAPLFTVALWYDGERPMGRVSDPLPMPPASAGGLDVRTRLVTQAIADAFAEGIAAHPVDWHMLQKLWLPGPGESIVDKKVSTVDSPG
jgi:lauroyl/myristoyl acyltransferase